MADKKKRIALIFGGKSVEHRISINSARNIYQYINRDLFEPVLIGIAADGKWYLCTSPDEKIESGVALSLKLDQPGVFYTNTGALEVDMAFPILHGTNGEDGSVQGLLQVMNIPFVGTGVLGSAVCMSKLLTKKILEEEGIPTAAFRSFHKSEKENIDFETLKNTLGLPFMVKAANLGSSIGINKVVDHASFLHALEDSFHFDHAVIIEQYISGREIECSVMGNEEPEVSYPGEIIISSEYEFYTFDAKYIDDQAVRLDVPARIEDGLRDKIRETCKKAYLALKCEDFARVDIFLTENGQFFINEINSIPGFTNSSMFPVMWKQHDISFTELISHLIELAEARYLKSKEIETNFISKLDT